MNYSLRLFALAALLLVLAVPPAAALDTLRVGSAGNISWTGETSGTDVLPILPEYKVNRQFSAVGNVPGNLIDLANLQVVTTRVLVKTVVDVDPLKYRKFKRPLPSYSGTQASAIEHVQGKH